MSQGTTDACTLGHPCMFLGTRPTNVGEAKGEKKTPNIYKIFIV